MGKSNLTLFQTHLQLFDLLLQLERKPVLFLNHLVFLLQRLDHLPLVLFLFLYLLLQRNTLVLHLSVFVLHSRGVNRFLGFKGPWSYLV
jgi:hypothetical protein